MHCVRKDRIFPPGLSRRVGLALLCLLLVAPGRAMEFHLHRVVSPAVLADPLALRHAGDDSGRLFIAEQSGKIRIFRNGKLLPGPFLDLGPGPAGLDRTSAEGERGLLGLDFHPCFKTNGRFFVNYTAAGMSPFVTGTTIIAEFRISAGDPDRADPDSQQVLLAIDQDFANHNGGDIHFGPDGYLYIAMGDGGSGNDPCNRAQTLDPADLESGCGGNTEPQIPDSLALLGKLLRIDVDAPTPPGSNQLCGAGEDGSDAYAIPPDNPFRGADGEHACDEVWAYGLRNPFRFSFDRLTGDLLIGDVGQNHWEEIDFEPADGTGGVNYGWRECEGRHATGSEQTCKFASQMPILEYKHEFGRCSVQGGYRYRGPVPALQGLYIHGDFCTGEIFLAEETKHGQWKNVHTLQMFGSDLVAFGEDEQGNVFVVSLREGIWRFDRYQFADGFED